MRQDRPLSHWITLARLGFEEDLARLMKKKDRSRSSLARAVGVSPQFITKMLNGTNNYTLATMAKMARGLGAVLEIRLVDEGNEVVRVVDLNTAASIDDGTISQPSPDAEQSETATGSEALVSRAEVG